jgi:hypothetical protein
LCWGWVFVKSKAIQKYHERFVSEEHEPFSNGIKIKYHYKGSTYYYVMKKKRGLRPVSEITNEFGKNITDEVVPFLGPNMDCHNTILFPGDFRYEKMIIRLVDGTYKEFNQHEQIKIY